MICLANSRKLQGRCVAGFRIDGTGWIRPVSSKEDGTLSYSQCKVDKGSDASLLDLLEIEVGDPRPVFYQPENILITKTPFRLISRPTANSDLNILSSAISVGPDIFGNCKDRLNIENLRKSPIDSSLTLVVPDTNEWLLTTSKVRGNRQLRVAFKLARVQYNLVVTDIEWEKQFHDCQIGQTFSNEDIGVSSENSMIFTISLGEPFGGYCYKLVAAVILIPRGLVFKK